MLNHAIYSLFLVASYAISSVAASDDLVRAVEAGNLKDVVSRLQAGDDPNYVYGKAAWTPLIVAADRKFSNIVETLLEYGANPNVAENDGWTPIMFSIIKNDMPSVKALVWGGARLDYVSKNDWTPQKAASRAGAAMTDYVRQQTARSKELAVENVANNKAFLQAVREGNLDEVRDMLNRGMNANAQSSNGWNANTYAAASGNSDLLTILIRRGVQVNKPDKDGWTPIMFAAFQGRPEIVKILLENGGDPFVENVFKTSAFTMAVENAKTKKDIKSIRLITDFGLEKALALDDAEAIMKYVRAPNANVNYQRKGGGKWTPLIFVTAKGRGDYVRELLGLGADPNIAENDGWTPLHFAVHGSKLEIVRLLLAAKADPNIKEKRSRTAFDLAAHSKDPALYKSILSTTASLGSESSIDPSNVVLPAFTETAPETTATATASFKGPKIPPRAAASTTSAAAASATNGASSTTTGAAASSSAKTSGRPSPPTTRGAGTSNTASSKSQAAPLREGPRRNAHRDNAYDDQPYFDFVEDAPVEEPEPQGFFGKIKGLFGM